MCNYCEDKATLQSDLLKGGFAAEYCPACGANLAPQELEPELKDRALAAAETLLHAKGFEILAIDYTCNAGSCAFVAQDDDCLVFMDVLAAYGPDFPESKPSRGAELERIAGAYLSDLDEAPVCPVRFDVVSLANVSIATGKALLRYHYNALSSNRNVDQLREEVA